MLKEIVNQLNSMTNLLTSYVDKMAHSMPSKTGLWNINDLSQHLHELKVFNLMTHKAK